MFNKSTRRLYLKKILDLIFLPRILSGFKFNVCSDVEDSYCFIIHGCKEFSTIVLTGANKYCAINKGSNILESSDEKKSSEFKKSFCTHTHSVNQSIDSMNFNTVP